jgi:predicted AlkP superfamily pyrophosphatase or phosphodiesterase
VYLGKMAEASIDALRLGQRDAVDYLGISFSALDIVGHGFGPRSHEVQDVLVRLDRTIGSLLDHLDKAVGPDQYVVALSADHGVAPIPEGSAIADGSAGRVDARQVTARVEEALKQGLGGEGPYVERLVFTDLYLKPGVVEKLVAAPKIYESLLEAIRQGPGVLDAFRGDELSAKRSSKDPAARAAALSYFPGRSGDVIIVPKPGWMNSPTGTTHGTSNEYDQRVPILFMGPGIKAGEYSQAATPADIAPTLAALVGITLPEADGQPLRQALTADK